MCGKFGGKMEKTWNKLKKSMSLKLFSSKKLTSTSSGSFDYPFDVSQVDLKPQISQSSSSGGRRFSRNSTFSSGSRSTKQNICSICLGSMKPGQGHAIFTAECSHTFHFKCITSNVKHGNHVCPVCRSTWKLMPVHTTTAPTDSQSSPVVGSSATRVTPMNPLPDERRAHRLPNQRAFWCESHHFKDDEPLCHINDSLDLTSPLAVSADQLVTIKAFPEVPAVGAAESLAAFTVLVGVQAPPLSEDTHQQARAPIDLVTVLDVSGSMKGTKLVLLKNAVRFVISNLGPADRLSIIAFSSTARRIFPLRRMSDVGRDCATLAIDSLVSSGGTNIAEGLNKGVQVLEQRREHNPVASIILLSDGKDTYSTTFGIDHQSPHHQDSLNSRWISYFLQLLPHAICPSNGVVVGDNSLPPIPVHTFGIGADHDATCMHAISDVSGGTFSFIQDVNIIQDAFARCIGGLLSVVAQQLKLKIIPLSPGVRICSIPSGKHTSEISNNGERGVVDVGDLYADEEKDFLVQVSLPVLSAAEESEELDPATPLLFFECSYKDLVSKRIALVESLPVNIRRPQNLSSVGNLVCLKVDRERNRLLVLKAIAEAQGLAERGNIEGAQTILEKQRVALLSSASAQAGDRLCKSLEAELNEIKERMGSQKLYQESGRAYTLSGMSSHSWQRTTTRGDNSKTISRDGYETPSMVTMVTKSQTSFQKRDYPKPVQSLNKSCSTGRGRA